MRQLCLYFAPCLSAALLVVTGCGSVPRTVVGESHSRNDTVHQYSFGADTTWVVVAEVADTESLMNCFQQMSEADIENLDVSHQEKMILRSRRVGAEKIKELYENKEEFRRFFHSWSGAMKKIRIASGTPPEAAFNSKFAIDASGDLSAEKIEKLKLALKSNSSNDVQSLYKKTTAVAMLQNTLSYLNQLVINTDGKLDQNHMKAFNQAVKGSILMAYAEIKAVDVEKLKEVNRAMETMKKITIKRGEWAVEYSVPEALSQEAGRLVQMLSGPVPEDANLKELIKSLSFSAEENIEEIRAQNKPAENDKQQEQPEVKVVDPAPKVEAKK